MITKKQLIAFETKIAKLWQSGKIKVPVHLSGGNENELIKIFKKIKQEDYVFSTHRNHYHYLLKGCPSNKLLLEIKQSQKGICSGHSGSMHTISYRHRFYSSGIVAGCVAIAVGVAKAIQARKRKYKVWVFCGDGCCDESWFYESWRYSVGHDLPIYFIIEDNNRSVCTSRQHRWGKYDGDFTEKI